jgi:hypothetical protein
MGLIRICGGCSSSVDVFSRFTLRIRILGRFDHGRVVLLHDAFQQTPYLHSLFACMQTVTAGSREHRLLIAHFLRLVRRGERKHGEGESARLINSVLRSAKGDGEPHTEAAGVGLLRIRSNTSRTWHPLSPALYIS